MARNPSLCIVLLVMNIIVKCQMLLGTPVLISGGCQGAGHDDDPKMRSLGNVYILTV